MRWAELWKFYLVVILVVGACAGCAAAFAQDKSARPSRAAAILDAMPRVKRVGEAALSPDGSLVAYVVNGKLAVIPVGGGAAQSLAVEGDAAARDVTWSADSKRLAFLTDLPGDTPAARVWTAGADGTAATKHAELKGNVERTRFSPDGKKLAILFLEGIPRASGPLEPMTPLAGVVDEKIYEQRIAVLDLETDHVAQVSPPDLYVYEYEWTPDGKSWVATAAHGAGDANWYVARIYLLNATTGEAREIYKPKLQIAVPRISPDGRQVAFIEGLMSDEGSTGGDIYLLPIAGGTARNLTPGIKASPYALAWTAADGITFAANVDGSTGFGNVSAAHGAVRMLWTGEEFAAPAGTAWAIAGSVAGEKPVTAIVRQSASTPPELWAGTIGNWKQLTEMNAGVKPTWGEMRTVHWMNGPMRLQGWLMLPKDLVPGKKYPLIVNVHGGPSAACLSHWNDRFMGIESAMGYFAFCPNPRGSYGQGESFTKANVKDFGGGDFRDIMTGVDALLKKYPIDSQRLGIRGHSYGGYMTMWAETHTQRFAGAVAGAGLSDWLSYYGLNDIDGWMIPFFGASVYEDPAAYAKSDPMHFVKAVKTPTLILVGDRDGEVPMEQSVEWWHALKTFDVPTMLVVYPNEGHAIGRPEDFRDYTLRTFDWFEKWFAKVPEEAFQPTKR
jgi:dipeptidyl aminopeptidase/acylaminoacyl peptidase